MTQFKVSPMQLISLLLIGLALCFEQITIGKQECVNYEAWSKAPHGPVSKGKLMLPFQRPPVRCRTFNSPAVEAKIKQVKTLIKDEDTARLWENAFPNTLDTTIKFHSAGLHPLTFVVTGDIDAEWLRDSHHQLSPYLTVLKELSDSERSLDPLNALIKGAIAQQARYIGRSPHCNAFHAPPESNIRPSASNENDAVWPYASPTYAFECKYELDSLASFLGLSNEYYEATGDSSFVTLEWITAVTRLIKFVKRTQTGTYDENTGEPIADPYRFSRWTNVGSETHWNKGSGHPTKYTGMARSWFRPSDDACVYQFFVPANAQISVELTRLASYADSELANESKALGKQIKEAVWKHGIVNHPKWGKVFAFEVDGFGSSLLMDDANLPSILSLPDMGFLSLDDKTYQRTRKMITSQEGNPYYIKGKYFEGIGGPHVGIRAAWPMSRIVAIRTTNDIQEIREHLKAVVYSAKDLGLVHETVNVDTNQYSRSWFAWANSEFAKAILDLEKRGLLAKATEHLF